jgi:hypothetical protein
MRLRLRFAPAEPALAEVLVGLCFLDPAGLSFTLAVWTEAKTFSGFGFRALESVAGGSFKSAASCGSIVSVSVLICISISMTTP